ncbi:hypothetical protein, partial [Comamonas terrigena]
SMVTASTPFAFLWRGEFSEFSPATGMWPTMLSDRIEELQNIGMLRAHSYVRSRQDSHLTCSAVVMSNVSENDEKI